MLKFGNKEFRNLQEQVLKNMQDINSLKEGTAVLDEFGIKVVGEVDSLADLPTVAEYKEAHEDWAYGDAYAVGTEAPYTLYILTRENETTTEDHWFDIGEFPAPGPQGETGPEGPVGPQGQTGNPGTDGVSAGFGTITATAQTLVPGSSATATVVASGPDTAKSFAFTFGIPRGQKGEPGGITDVEVNDDTVVVDGVAKIDLDQYSIAFLDRNQTFSGSNTFNGDATFANGIIIDRPGTAGTSKWRIVEAQTGELSIDRRTTGNWYKSFDFTPSFFTSYTRATLGTSTTPFSDIYFDGILSDCNNTDYGLVLPDTTNFTANKTLATTDEIPTATSDLTNDSGFITSSALSSYATTTYVDTGLSAKQNTLVSGTNIKTINNESILGSGNINIQVGGGANLTPLEAEDDYIDLLEFINSVENPATYTISNENSVYVEIIKEDGDEGLYLPKGCIISVYPHLSAAILSTDGQYTYLVDGDYLSGGKSINSEDLSNYVTTNTAQEISGAKTFTTAVILKNNVGVKYGNSYSNGFTISNDGSGGLLFKNNYNVSKYHFTDSYFYPDVSGASSLGSSSKAWGDLYLTGNLSNGTNSITVANIANKNNFITLTQAEYDALATKDPNTYYFIEEE